MGDSIEVLARLDQLINLGHTLVALVVGMTTVVVVTFPFLVRWVHYQVVVFRGLGQDLKDLKALGERNRNDSDGDDWKRH